jgi:hypothetical protein
MAAKGSKSSALAEFAEQNGIAAGCPKEEPIHLNVKFVGADKLVYQELVKMFPESGATDLIRTAVYLLHKEAKRQKTMNSG